MITPGHPVFRELAALQKGIDVFPDPQEGAYALCRAYNSNATGCGNGRKKHENRINALLAEFRGMIECPHTDTFYHQLTEFLTITHCFWHRDELLARLEEWKKQRQQGASSLSTSLTASGTGCSNPQEFLSEKSNVTASTQSPCVKQPVQLGIDRTVAEDTSKATSAKSASSSACLSVMDSIQLSNLSPMSATTIGSTVETTNSAEIGDIATGVSKLKLATSHHSTSDGSLLNAAEDIIPGIGIASLQRKGTRRDTSPVLKEIYKHLNDTQQKEGIVYILEHSEIEGLFKVGWTTKTAAERQLQPTNCYGTKTNVIHETIDGPFVGAQKVEALVHTILRHYNLQVTNCELCGRGHREWFSSRREVVCDTVMSMESFVRLPAYTLQDGKMKLSPAAHETIDNMFNFSLQKLAAITASTKTQFEVKKYTSEKVTEITSPQTQRMTTELLEQQAREGTVQGVHGSGQPTTPSPQRKKKRIGARLANTIGKATDWARIRSREATPEAGEAEIETTGDRKSTPVTSPLQGIIEDACVGFVWNMLPEEVKASEGEQDSTKNNRPRSLTDLKRVMRKAYQNVRSDFKAEWQERREEGKA
ncbi:hypothetical protein FG10108.1 [Paecilomyces variotii No. 5]|uniref:Bacteriophage T5 Orf172 DNA-binding domain-containing protein n=1 Tax=Byssochlamys spectabilis (strain No. 5 / NBRC 109023) TaxID=1356009 RepID=V5G6Q5_BYSSN|nr:hypothetical protein FG10108.1 [Paecilomyces variotii No. 5]